MANTYNILWILIILQLHSITTIGLAQRNSFNNDLAPHGGDFASYGEFCDSPSLVSSSSSSTGSKVSSLQKCDGKALLRCNRGLCICFHPEDMIFDVIKGQCVAKAGARCKFGRDELITLETKSQRVPCVVNGVCNSEGICQCSSMYYNSLNVTCLSQKTFDGSCHFDAECRQDYNLRCVDGFCQCDPRVSARHKRYELCLGLVGESPIEGNCVEFAEKVQLTLGPGSLSVCACQEGYIKGASKRCHGAMGKACTSQSPCQNKLSCVQGTCQCPLPDYQRYDPEGDNDNQCLSNVYGPCSTSADCVPEAFCNNTGIYSQCECKHGYVVGPTSSVCEKSIGTACQVVLAHRILRSHDIDEDPGLSGQARSHNQGNRRSDRSSYIRLGFMDECSASASLQCRNGVCQCPDLQVFSEEWTKCVGLVGSVCKKSKTNSSVPVCVDNAECLYKTEESDFGLCSCTPEFTVNQNRSCVPVIATSLSPQNNVPASNSSSGSDASEIANVELESEFESNVDTNGNASDQFSFQYEPGPGLSKNETEELAIEFEKILYGKFDNSTFLKILRAFNKAKDKV